MRAGSRSSPLSHTRLTGLRPERLPPLNRQTRTRRMMKSSTTGRTSSKRFAQMREFAATALSSARPGRE